MSDKENQLVYSDAAHAAAIAAAKALAGIQFVTQDSPFYPQDLSPSLEPSTETYFPFPALDKSNNLIQTANIATAQYPTPFYFPENDVPVVQVPAPSQDSPLKLMKKILSHSNPSKIYKCPNVSCSKVIFLYFRNL